MKLKSILGVFAVFLLSVVIWYGAYTIYSLEEEVDLQKHRANMWKNEYNSTQRELSNTEEELQDKWRRLNETEEELNETEGKLNKTQEELKSAKDTLERSEVYYIPTPEKVEDVVWDTDIDDNEYSDDYVCTEYSYDLMDAFRERGIHSCGVVVNFEDGGAHMFVAVNTTEGIRYVEPQDDTVFEEISLGEDYCDIVDWKCDWTLEKISSCYGILKV